MSLVAGEWEVPVQQGLQKEVEEKEEDEEEKTEEEDKDGHSMH